MQSLQPINAIIRRDDVGETVGRIVDARFVEQPPALPSHIETFLAALQADWKQDYSPEWCPRVSNGYLALIAMLSGPQLREIHRLLFARHGYRPTGPQVAAAVCEVVPNAEKLPGFARAASQSAGEMREQNLQILALPSAAASGKKGQDFARETMQRLRDATPGLGRVNPAAFDSALDVIPVDQEAMDAKRRLLRRQAELLMAGKEDAARGLGHDIAAIGEA